MKAWRRALQAAAKTSDAAALKPLLIALEEAATERAAASNLFFDLSETDYSTEEEEERAEDEGTPLWATAKAREGGDEERGGRSWNLILIV